MRTCCERSCFLLSQRQLIQEALDRPGAPKGGAFTVRFRRAVKEVQSIGTTLHASVLAWKPQSDKIMRRTTVLQGFTRAGSGGMGAKRLLRELASARFFSAARLNAPYNAAARLAEMQDDADDEKDKENDEPASPTGARLTYGVRRSAAGMPLFSSPLVSVRTGLVRPVWGPRRSDREGRRR